MVVVVLLQGIPSMVTPLKYSAPFLVVTILLPVNRFKFLDDFSFLNLQNFLMVMIWAFLVG